METEELMAKLAADSMALESALGENFDDDARSRMADVLMGVRQRERGDCALDIIINDRPVGVRVRLQMIAKQSGYQRPWPRHGADAV